MSKHEAASASNPHTQTPNLRMYQYRKQKTIKLQLHASYTPATLQLQSSYTPVKPQSKVTAAFDA